MSYDNGGMCCPRCRRGSNLEVASRPPRAEDRRRLGLPDGPPVQVKCYACGHEDPDFRWICDAIRRDDQRAADRECEELGHRVIALLGKCTRCNRPMTAEAS